MQRYGIFGLVQKLVHHPAAQITGFEMDIGRAVPVIVI
jgi:hypothetical protein